MDNIKRSTLKVKTLISNYSRPSISIVDVKEKNETARTGREDQGLLQSKTEPKADIDLLDFEELRQFAKMTERKKKNFENKNQKLLEQIEKIKDELSEVQKLNGGLQELQNRELEILQNVCKKNMKDFKAYKKAYQTIETSKISMKFADEAIKSINSKDDIESFVPKWLHNDATFEKKSENWQFVLKKQNLQSNKKITQISVDLNKISPDSILVEDIRISSSESNFN